MAQEISDELVRESPSPAKGNRIIHEQSVTGLAVRITAAARDGAEALARRVKRGRDPMGARHGEREAPSGKRRASVT